MHTSAHTIRRNGKLYYNRRVPTHAVTVYGSQIRLRIDTYEQADLLTKRLDAVWSNPAQVTRIDLEGLLALTDTPPTLSEATHEYLSFRCAQQKHVWLAVRTLISIAGDVGIEHYSRRDGRAFVQSQLQTNRTGTVRRRLNSLCAIFNYAYKEYEVERRNPFAGLLIPKEGNDKQQRQPFTIDQLQEAYRVALGGKSRVRLCVPILGETGCRIAEVIGLRKQDVDLEGRMIRVRPHAHRSLKTTGSQRDIPLVGVALEAAQRLTVDTSSPFLFPEYIRDDKGCMATHASNTINKWLKRDFGGRTAHCLRHAFRDRLRAVECPLEMIDALGGWSSVGTAGSRYGHGFDLEHKRKWLEKIAKGIVNENI